MKLPFELVVRDGTLSPDARADLASLASNLDRFCGRVMRCRVTATGPGRHAHGGWALRITMTVPGRDLVVTRQSGDSLGEASREAFTAASRRLEDYVRRRRGFVKTSSQE
jgi:hypothetical protein